MKFCFKKNIILVWKNILYEKCDYNVSDSSILFIYYLFNCLFTHLLFIYLFI